MKKAVLILSLIVTLISSLALLSARQVQARQAADRVPLEIRRVVVIDKQPAVLLMDLKQERYLLIFIDFFMATSIQQALENASFPRPMTHDLLAALLKKLNARVTQVDITELKDSTYFALITLEVNGRTEHLDARPSDALAIAARAKATILAAPDLLRTMDEPPPGMEQPHHPDESTPEEQTDAMPKVQT